MPTFRQPFGRHALAAALAALIQGCASPGPTGRYYSVYEVKGSPQIGATAAESALAAAVAASSVGRFDKPIALLRAPQPVMPPEDTEQRVVGRVVVEIHFSESGLVDNVTVVSSSKPSLTEAVLRAVSAWQIAL